MNNALDKLTIKGFRSIKSLEDFELKNLNVLIGGNGYRFKLAPTADEKVLINDEERYYKLSRTVIRLFKKLRNWKGKLL